MKKAMGIEKGEDGKKGQGSLLFLAIRRPNTG